jgi:GAF domain-containing protein
MSREQGGPEPVVREPGAADGPSEVLPPLLGADLEDLLQEVLQRVDEVVGDQQRLRLLLDAVVVLVAEVSLHSVLERIVEAACRLSGARFGALAVLGVGTESRLRSFVAHGVTEEEYRRVGDPPRGRGLLGHLIDVPEPLRLHDLHRHEAAYGYPQHHPPMSTFLGVPIRIRGRVFGNLYLTEKVTGGEFSRDDEDLVTALAGAAAVAVENATLFAETRRRRDWQTAMTGVATTLFGGVDRDQSIAQLVQHALRASAADGAAFTAPADEPDTLEVVAALGLLAPWQGHTVAQDESLAGRVLVERQVVAVAEADTDAWTSYAADVIPGLSAIVAAPVVGAHGVHGVLSLAYQRDCSFDAADRDMIEGFTAQAGATLDMADLRRDNERMRLLEDRQRIAQDLQETVIRELFSLGLDLQGIAARSTSPAITASLTGNVERLDRIIRAVRAAVFALQPGPDAGTNGT